jgi:hypothetical protein
MARIGLHGGRKLETMSSANALIFRRSVSGNVSGEC